MTESEIRVAVIEPRDRGVFTCTHGQPGDDDANYALAWIPLSKPERHTEHVRARHARNVQALLLGAQWTR